MGLSKFRSRCPQAQRIKDPILDANFSDLPTASAENLDFLFLKEAINPLSKGSLFVLFQWYGNVNIPIFEHSVIITEPFLCYASEVAENFTEVRIPRLALAYHSPLKHYLPSFSPLQLTTHSGGKWAGNYVLLKLQRKSYQHNAVITLNQAKGVPQCKLSICAGCTAPERVKRVRRAFRNT